MSANPQMNKPLLAQVFDALWSDPQMQQELFRLVEEVAEGIVSREYAMDWILLRAAEKLPGRAKQLGALNVSPLINFVRVYTGERETSPLPTVQANIVEIVLTAQAFVKGALTIEVFPDFHRKRLCNAR